MLHNKLHNKPAENMLKSQKGVALLMALFLSTVLLFLAMEVSYDSQVEYVSAHHKLSKLKAQYAARAGARLGLLRILLYQKSVHIYKSKLGASSEQGVEVLDTLWNLPFAWPPVALDPTSVRARDDVAEAINASIMGKGQYLLTIENESAKINMSSLGSEFQALARVAQKQLLQLLENFKDSGNLPDTTQRSDMQELINHIADWVDADDVSRNGGTESSYYSEVQAENIPPNRNFRSLDELLMVHGMGPGLLALLQPHISIFSGTEINISMAKNEILKSLSPQITDSVIEQLETLRSEGAGVFNNKSDFFSFLENQGVNTSTLEDVEEFLSFAGASTFRIVSTGTYGKSVSEIEAVVQDPAALLRHFAKLLDVEQRLKAGNTSQEGSGDKKPPELSPAPMPKSRPHVVWWEES